MAGLIALNGQVYDINSLRRNLHIEGRLILRGANILQLPEGLHVGGSLDLTDASLSQLPDHLDVGGDLALGGTWISALPGRFRVCGFPVRRLRIVRLVDEAHRPERLQKEDRDGVGQDGATALAPLSAPGHRAGPGRSTRTGMALSTERLMKPCTKSGKASTAQAPVAVGACRQRPSIAEAQSSNRARRARPGVSWPTAGVAGIGSVIRRLRGR
jgi:hypothetical protein